MQQIPVYLYSNKIYLYTNFESWTNQRYRQVYQRNLKAYRGVDNRIDFEVRNADQKKQDISALDIVFTLWAYDSKELILSRACTVVDNNSGRAYITISESEAQQLKDGFYQYSVYGLKDSQHKIPLYFDSQYDAVGTLEMISSTFPEPVQSTELTDFFNDVGQYVVTSAIDAKPGYNQNAGLHTFAVYMANFTGELIIQGSLQDNPTVWADIETHNITNSGLDYYNITGVWLWLRVKIKTTSGSIDKILYRY